VKLFAVVLLALFALLQYELWFSQGGLDSIFHMRQAIKQQALVNQKARLKNQALIADVHDLKSGNEAVEERARTNLGLVKKGEVFYQVVHTAPEQKDATQREQY
jgi:cell division protein FtsB